MSHPIPYTKNTPSKKSSLTYINLPFNNMMFINKPNKVRQAIACNKISLPAKITSQYILVFVMPTFFMKLMGPPWMIIMPLTTRRPNTTNTTVESSAKETRTIDLNISGNIQTPITSYTTKKGEASFSCNP